MFVCVGIPNLAPVMVILNTVDGQRDHLHTSFLELITDPGGTGQFCGADWSKVFWVGKQDTPPVEEKRHQVMKFLF